MAEPDLIIEPDIHTKEDRRLRNESARARFNELVGPVPHCGPADRMAARDYLNRVEVAIGKGGWTPTIQNRLYRLRDKWKARADGKDIRFEIMGNVCRPPTDRERDQIRLLSVTRELKEIAIGNSTS